MRDVERTHLLDKSSMKFLNDARKAIEDWRDTKTGGYLRYGKLIQKYPPGKETTSNGKTVPAVTIRSRGQIARTSPFWTIPKQAYLDFGILEHIYNKLHPEPPITYQRDPDHFSAKDGSPLAAPRESRTWYRAGGSFTGKRGKLDDRFADAVPHEKRLQTFEDLLGANSREFYGKGVPISSKMELDYSEAWKKCREMRESIEDDSSMYSELHTFEKERRKEQTLKRK